jgi:hypothetical protein
MILGKPDVDKRVEGEFPPAVITTLREAGWVDIEDLEVADLAQAAGSAGEEGAEPTPPAGNASREEWVAFAATLGITVEDSTKRDEIRALVEQLLDQNDDEDDSDDESE